jgi:hypothetical protein
MDIIILLLMSVIFLPLTAGGMYMWFTGKGRSMIAGYNTMSKTQQAYFDGEKLAKDVGKLIVLISLLVLTGILSILFLPHGMAILTASIGLTIVACIVFLAYSNRSGGRRYLKDPLRQPPPPTKAERKKVLAIAGVAIFATAIVIVAVFVFSGYGSVDASMDDERLFVKAPMVDERIYYDNIVSVSLQEDLDLGQRVGGFGGTNVQSGKFNNGAFGDYTLAAYNDVKTYIVVERSAGKMLVFNQDDVIKTVEFCSELSEKVSLKSAV